MKIGFAQINTTVGDFKGNRDKILAAYGSLKKQKADIVIFPELAVCGYPPRDLLLEDSFIQASIETLNKITSNIGETPALIGFVQPNNDRKGKPIFNAVAWCQNGEISDIAKKCLLPTYDVFDEDRYFQKGEKPIIVNYQNKKIGITICEDIWVHPDHPTTHNYSFNPVEYLSKQSTDLILNLSASPWHIDKEKERNSTLTHAAKTCNSPIAYCNLIGGNDELVFDGGSKLISKTGETLHQLPQFKETLSLCELDTTTTEKDETNELESIHNALVIGLKDYAWKSGFKKAVLGLSGGIDSAVTAEIAVKALGKDNVIGISLPSSISSQHSKDDAKELAENLGIEYQVLPIGDIVANAEQVLSPMFKGLARDTTEENLQARSRGLLLMAVSNKMNALLLTTGNKSELAVGYCTLYGDMCGGLAVISDLEKLKVYELARFINRDKEIIPTSTIDKPPSAELSPDQVDQDSLPPYEILDAILKAYVEEKKSFDEIIALGFDSIIVKDILKKVDRNEYKRKQAAPGLKITPLAFGTGRRIPLVQKFSASKFDSTNS